MRRENKKFWSNGHTFLIYFSILLTLVAFSSAEATTSVTLTPDSLSADDPGMTELTADIASPGNTVWVDIFIDADKDGIIDPEEAKVMSFSLTDGTGSPEIAGVTNTNVNGDEDGTVNSSVTTTLKFYYPPNPAGQFIIQVTDEDSSHAEAIFTFTQAATSQSISGTVTCDGLPVAGAIVEVESPDVDDCDAGAAAITDQDGNYQIYLEDPGTYSVDVDAQGYLGKDDGGSELDGIIVDGHETGKDLKLFNGNRHITGTIKDKDTDQGIGGVWVEAEIENGIEYWSEAITDHDGSFDIVVIDGTWGFEVDDEDLQVKGYVGTDLDDIIVAGFDVPDQDVSLPPATALITGSVEDQSHNPVSACVGAETEIEGVEYWSETVTDPSGNYILGVIAGNWEVHAEPLCEPYLIEPPEQYISIADSQVKTLNFICAPAGAISGNVRDSNNQPIEGLWVHAFDNACGGNWLGGDHTDCNGDYTIYGLPAGDCYVQTCASCDGLNYVDEWYDNATDCNEAAPVPVPLNSTHENINFTISVASEFKVNQFTGFPSGEGAEDPAIATDSNNHIIITWEDPRYSDDNVFARIFDNIGNPLTNDFRVDQDPNIGSDPSIAVDSNDHFIITWEETRFDQNPENDDIFARIFDSTGNPLTNEYRVDQDTGTNEAVEPVIATDSNNNFIIAWNDSRNGNGDIFARRFDINGAPLGDEFRIDQDTGLNDAETPEIATDSNNNFIITWTDYRSGHTDIFARIFNNNGVPLSDEFKVNQFTGFPSGEGAEDPAIATDSNNHIIITWEDPRYSDDNVFARIFDNIGNPLTNDFRVDQDPNIGSDPSIAVDSNDHFIITWEETRFDQNPENDDIFARIFDSTGNPLTNEYRVDQDTGTNEAVEPVIATDGNNFIIAWTDYRSGHGDIFAIMEVSPGDANGDGSTNVQDVICIINVILDPAFSPEGDPDCNEDGSVNVQDVICVINKILGG